MNKNTPSLSVQFDPEHPHGRYVISRGQYTEEYEILFSRAIGADEEWSLSPPTADVAAEYERLIGKPEFSPQPPTMNLVELLTGEEDSAFDQPCRFGHRVDGHAVYCHNEDWLYAPRKCRRTWYTGGEVRDEDCRGFQPNPSITDP